MGEIQRPDQSVSEFVGLVSRDAEWGGVVAHLAGLMDRPQALLDQLLASGPSRSERLGLAARCAAMVGRSGDSEAVRAEGARLRDMVFRACWSEFAAGATYGGSRPIDVGVRALAARGPKLQDGERSYLDTVLRMLREPRAEERRQAARIVACLNLPTCTPEIVRELGRSLGMGIAAYVALAALDISGALDALDAEQRTELGRQVLGMYQRRSPVEVERLRSGIPAFVELMYQVRSSDGLRKLLTASDREGEMAARMDLADSMLDRVERLGWCEDPMTAVAAVFEGLVGMLSQEWDRGQAEAAMGELAFGRSAANTLALLAGASERSAGPDRDRFVRDHISQAGLESRRERVMWLYETMVTAGWGRR